MIQERFCCDVCWIQAFMELENVNVSDGGGAKLAAGAKDDSQLAL